MSQSNLSDKSDTQALLEKIHGTSSGNNWLGHKYGSGAAKIDSLLLAGATDKQLSEYRGAVDEHIAHLKKVHGLDIETVDGLTRFK